MPTTTEPACSFADTSWPRTRGRPTPTSPCGRTSRRSPGRWTGPHWPRATPRTSWSRTRNGSSGARSCRSWDPSCGKGRPLYYAATYGYDRYHTLAFANENAWERSSFLRHRRLLEIGQEIWPGEYYPGYPTRVILKNELHFVVAYGETAAARRRSRVELWNKQGQIVTALNNPQTEGMVLFVCSTTGSAARRWLSDKSLPRFAQRIEEHRSIEAGPIRLALKDHPDADGQFKAHLLLLSGRADRSELPPEAESGPIENGLSLRLRIPYPKARISELRVNGRPARISPRDGYLTWVARGFTYVQINIPPERSPERDLFVVTCLYDPGEERVFGLGWQE